MRNCLSEIDYACAIIRLRFCVGAKLNVLGLAGLVLAWVTLPLSPSIPPTLFLSCTLHAECGHW